MTFYLEDRPMTSFKQLLFQGGMATIGDITNQGY